MFNLVAALLLLPASAATCPVTLAPDPPFVPPAPYAATPPSGFWFGNPRLWTLLGGPNWNFRPRGSTAYRNKVAWFQPGLIRANRLSPRGPHLVVTATRLDGPAEPVMTRAPLSYREQDWKAFFMSAIDIPVAGCWEIRATRAGETLRFVVHVGE